MRIPAAAMKDSMVIPKTLRITLAYEIASPLGEYTPNSKSRDPNTDAFMLMRVYTTAKR